MAEYIERETTLDALRKAHNPNTARMAISFAAVNSVPAADVRPVVRGHWIWDDEGYHCSECWFHACGNTLECMDGTYRFCPSCGAEMEGE